MVTTPGTEGLEFSLIGNDDADDYQVDRAEACRSFIGSLRQLLLGPDPHRSQSIWISCASSCIEVAKSTTLPTSQACQLRRRSRHRNY
ncbi:hypothetical protein EV2_045298 [Malus domestica]